ncbi:hypothetical protein OWR29_35335 [Actinoplanes sp. Pm04-4]|uniref:MarR family transcriptional regulator n=1 Tax=Paractinoplanes pyxinae TaxID=2997416 RepID=A0ABT4B9V7_9ACTN|nr:hypothetical protein [Actinoplanes pyxinae]MCY1143299.1 hypothetical protein [Actinoplanes pyxinae]
MMTIPFGAQLIGRTEKALNALLDQALQGTGLTEPQWVALTLTATRTPTAAATSDDAAFASEPVVPGASLAPEHTPPMASRIGGPGSNPEVVGQFPADLIARIAEALRVGEPAARERLAELAGAGLVHTTSGGAVEPTERGLALWQDVRAQVMRLTDKLWGDVPEADRAAAGRVLNVVLARAGALLS